MARAKKATRKTASYRAAGVDIDAGDEVVRRIRKAPAMSDRRSDILTCGQKAQGRDPSRVRDLPPPR